MLPGLASLPDLIDEAEERELILAIERTDLAPFRFQGWRGKRFTHSFGWHYDFDTQRVSRAEPIPDWLQPIRQRIAAFAGLEHDRLIRALLTRYGPGAGIGWHRDKPVYEHVLGLSLGAPADMRFRRRRPGGDFDRVVMPLRPRAAYHIFGEARREWEHSIVDMSEPRWSITFRTPSMKGRSLFRDQPLPRRWSDHAS